MTEFHQTIALCTARVRDYIGFAEKLPLLRCYGADVNARNDKGLALVHNITEPEFIPAMLSAGSDMNCIHYQRRIQIRSSGPNDPEVSRRVTDAGAVN